MAFQLTCHIYRSLNTASKYLTPISGYHTKSGVYGYNPKFQPQAHQNHGTQQFKFNDWKNGK